MERVKAFFLMTAVVFMVVGCISKEAGLMGDLAPALPSPYLLDTIKPKSDSVMAVKKRIYLTIDDAPITGTEYIDSVIAAEKVKASLFVVGSAVNGSGRFRKYYNLLLHNSHVEVLNHSYSHANNKYASYYKNPELVLEDFEKNQTELGISHKIVRLPGRNLWRVGSKKRNYKQTGSTSADLLAENGYDIYGWDVEWKYSSKDYTPKQTIDELVKEVKEAYESKHGTFTAGHLVLLMHNQMFAKVGESNNLGELIAKLKSEGFSFEYLSAYPRPEQAGAATAGVKAVQPDSTFALLSDSTLRLWPNDYPLLGEFSLSRRLAMSSAYVGSYAGWPQY